jgi:hypothetical protein
MTGSVVVGFCLVEVGPSAGEEGSMTGSVVVGFCLVEVGSSAGSTGPAVGGGGACVARLVVDELVAVGVGTGERVDGGS